MFMFMFKFMFKFKRTFKGDEARQEGLEPPTDGFGDRNSTN